ncbi:MAG: hypothetical protein AAGF99_01355 [Bacteroidota bacterium]
MLAASGAHPDPTMIHQTLLIALEDAYRTAPAHAHRLDTVSVGIGASRVKFRLLDTDEGPDGRVDRALFAKALGDAARLAAQSVADGRAIASEGFTVAVQRLNVSGPIEAQARVAGVAEDRVVVRALLFDGDGEQVGQLRGLIQLAPAHDELADPVDEGAIRDAEALLDDEVEDAAEDDAPSRVPVQTAFVWQTPHGKLFMN